MTTIAYVRFKALPGRRFEVVKGGEHTPPLEGGMCESKDGKECCFFHKDVCPTGAIELCEGTTKTIFRETK